MGSKFWASEMTFDVVVHLYIQSVVHSISIEHFTYVQRPEGDS